MLNAEVIVDPGTTVPVLSIDGLMVTTGGTTGRACVYRTSAKRKLKEYRTKNKCFKLLPAICDVNVRVYVVPRARAHSPCKSQFECPTTSVISSRQG
jgi:hypothetical protein